MKPLRKKLNEAARVILAADGFVPELHVDFMKTDNPRGKRAWRQACAAYEVFFGKTPNPTEYEDD